MINISKAPIFEFSEKCAKEKSKRKCEKTKKYKNYNYSWHNKFVSIQMSLNALNTIAIKRQIDHCDRERWIDIDEQITSLNAMWFPRSLRWDLWGSVRERVRDMDHMREPERTWVCLKFFSVWRECVRNDPKFGNLWFFFFFFFLISNFFSFFFFGENF